MLLVSREKTCSHWRHRNQMVITGHTGTVQRGWIDCTWIIDHATSHPVHRRSNWMRRRVHGQRTPRIEVRVTQSTALLEEAPSRKPRWCTDDRAGSARQEETLGSRGARDGRIKSPCSFAGGVCYAEHPAQRGATSCKRLLGLLKRGAIDWAQHSAPEVVHRCRTGIYVE